MRTCTRKFLVQLIVITVITTAMLAIKTGVFQETITTFAPVSGSAKAAKHKVAFNRYQVPVMTLYIADADGKNERALLPNPGLEYSPSYSTDGKWIIFTGERNEQADLYRIHPDGTGLEQLTNDPAFDDQGTLSPDERTLAFVSSRQGGTANVWLMDMGTKKMTNLTAHPSGNFRPSWSPDGQWIAFTSDRDSAPGTVPGRWERLQSTGLYLIAPNGKGLRRLTRKEGVAGSPTWSKDGRRVLFYETDEVGGVLARAGATRTEIVSIEIATGLRTVQTASNETKLSPHYLADGKISYIKRSDDETAGLRIRHSNRLVETVIRGAVRNPSWSPDEKRVVFQRISRLGSTQHLIPTLNLDADFELFQNEPFATISPDRKQMLFSQYTSRKPAAGLLVSSIPGDTSIEVKNLLSGDQRTLFHRPGFSAFCAVWSPNGTEIALSVGRYFRSPGTPPAQIALMRSDGSDFRLVVDDKENNGFPSWSPDGKRIVFKRGRQLVIMELATRQITPLTDGSHYDNFPQWSPKGDTIMFTSDRSGDFELYTIRPNGEGLRRLTNAPGSSAHSTWCTEGDWILFASGRMGFKDEIALYDSVPQPYGEIFAMRADGSDIRQLTDNKWEDASPACIH